MENCRSSSLRANYHIERCGIILCKLLMIQQLDTSQFCMSIRLIYMSQTVHTLQHVDQTEIHVESQNRKNNQNTLLQLLTF